MINSIVLKSISQRSYDALYEVGNTEFEIITIAKKRLLVVLLLMFGLTPIFIYKGSKPFIILLPLIASTLIWFGMDRSFSTKLKEVRRDRHFEFLSFAKLIVPYLKGSSENKSLYSVLDKMNRRMGTGLLHDNLNRLMIEIGEEPGVPDPMIRFAKTVSNTDLAEDFMVALFDWQQTTDDVAVIARMERKITQAMMMRIDEIIKHKENRFAFYVARIFYSIFFLILGVLVVVLMTQLVPLLDMI
ncbi:MULTISPECIES: hypothetical protein [Erysipelothrix]|uniref:hypothetical protein n=1 Tax=Erysipelothrix TaxID=1647 RepID=UPI00140E2172|nr:MULTISPECIES: hypothetical protein [Erysipelothrix]MDV7678457.1 hypothetical protein [Erysipelothrix rhusiopathiae]WMT70157.1 hypothetical protein K0H77_01205 [Erysipelothrix rhusiopathiae]